jgi:hypothetical protein
MANTNPLEATRSAAIVHAAIFDAVNGIERRYSPIHVPPAAESGASRRAAVIQAAYVTLTKLFPTQKLILDAKREVALDAVSKRGNSGNRDDDDDRSSASIPRGIAWGQKVADAIWDWRSTDGFTPPPPPFLGGTNIGQWRPTPPAFAPGLGPQFATMTPWVINSPSQFRPSGPPPLNSDQYTRDFNEVKTMGNISSTTRSADQTLSAFFWNSTSATYLWDSAAVSLLARRRASLSESSLLLAKLNIAMADAAIGCSESKYNFVFWRPATAIPLAADDGNPATAPDPSWTPLLVTPPHPEYASGHSCVSGAASVVLAKTFGESTQFTMKSDVMLGHTRSFRGFSNALEDVKDARIRGGIHFRTACEHGQKIGLQIATYVLENAFRR